MEEDACLRLFIRLRWPQGARCPFCGSAEIVLLTSHYRRHYHRYICKTCTRKLGKRRTFNDLTGTIFEGTKLPLTKWFTAGRLLRKEKSTASIARESGVGYLTARRMVRLLVGCPYLTGIVEGGHHRAKL